MDYDNIRFILDYHHVPTDERTGWKLENCDCGQHYIWRDDPQLQHGGAVLGYEEKTIHCVACGRPHLLPESVKTDLLWEPIIRLMSEHQRLIESLTLAGQAVLEVPTYDSKAYYEVCDGYVLSVDTNDYVIRKYIQMKTATDLNELRDSIKSRYDFSKDIWVSIKVFVKANYNHVMNFKFALSYWENQVSNLQKKAGW